MHKDCFLDEVVSTTGHLSAMRQIIRGMTGAGKSPADRGPFKAQTITLSERADDQLELGEPVFIQI